MYKQAFGLTKNPFSLTPDPEFLYLNTVNREALAGLTYAIMGRKGFVLLVGDAGTGKTTLISRVLERASPLAIRFSLILNPKLTPAEFLELVLIEFGFTDIPSSKAQRIVILQNFLLNAALEGRIAALIVDEAHALSPELLEEIRLLGNFERRDRKLLQIVLSGQTELDQLLNREELRQFKQRIAVRLTLHPLSSGEVDQYIRHRWLTAGGAAGKHPFTPEAVASVAQWSKGIPRLVNSICDNALTLAVAEGTTSVTAAQITEASRDLNLILKPSGAGPRPAQNGNALASQPPVLPMSIPTLDRYSNATSKPALLKRLAMKIGFNRPPVVERSAEAKS